METTSSVNQQQESRPKIKIVPAKKTKVKLPQEVKDHLHEQEITTVLNYTKTSPFWESSGIVKFARIVSVLLLLGALLCFVMALASGKEIMVIDEKNWLGEVVKSHNKYELGYYGKEFCIYGIIGLFESLSLFLFANIAFRLECVVGRRNIVPQQDGGGFILFGLWLVGLFIYGWISLVSGVEKGHTMVGFGLSVASILSMAMPLCLIKIGNMAKTLYCNEEFESTNNEQNEYVQESGAGEEGNHLENPVVNN